jgi:hypothetical protein
VLNSTQRLLAVLSGRLVESTGLAATQPFAVSRVATVVLG